MILAEYGDTPGEGGQGRSRKRADLPPAGPLERATRRRRGGFGDAQKPRLPGAPLPALARGVAVFGEDH